MDQGRSMKPVRGVRRDSINELFIVALTIFSLMVVAAYYLLPLAQATRQALLWIDIPISLIFLADSFRCLRRASSRAGYLKWGWLDFVGSIPLALPLRLARLRRLASAWHALQLRRLRQVGEDLDENRAQSAALLMLLLAIVVLTSSTVAVLEFESEVPEANIHSGEEAFWWAFVTLATVGYGDYYPVTVSGRIAAAALMIVGVGIFGVLASYLANFFLPARSQDEPAGLDEVKAELEALNARLDVMEGMLDDRLPGAAAPMVGQSERPSGES